MYSVCSLVLRQKLLFTLTANCTVGNITFQHKITVFTTAALKSREVSVSLDTTQLRVLHVVTLTIWWSSVSSWLYPALLWECSRRFRRMRSNGQLGWSCSRRGDIWCSRGCFWGSSLICKCWTSFTSWAVSSLHIKACRGSCHFRQLRRVPRFAAIQAERWMSLLADNVSWAAEFLWILNLMEGLFIETSRQYLPSILV